VLINKFAKIFSIFLCKSSVEAGIASFLSSAVKAASRVLLVVFVLSALRINVFSIMAAISASLVALGFALKDNISNFAAGVLIILNKPIRVGDKVKIGAAEGEVVKIDTNFTVLYGKNKSFVIPNSKIISEIIEKESKFDIVSLNLKYKTEFEIDSRNFEKIRRMFEDRVISCDKILTMPPCKIRISDCDLLIDAWIQKNNRDNAREKIEFLLKEIFAKNGLKINL
jgi:small conductance mechanosensitive channel